ncbi:hypothetical protein PR202_gb18616 [Eleusine coracana subsp. coracana]|uniref:Lysine-specific demethylase ELF6 n=1 Tax=Eleusine coracana subsp. coracana TaxID=191504 RepID=A0AAV5F5W0_ELECO|nr:hypothetical protein PR202_gb18616 [Eleusine coracana subsp. coracana]
MSPPPAVAGGPAETPVPAWLRGLPRAPEYHPTESEFADPIAFLSRVEREAAAYGICKVIPPYQRPSRRFVFAHLNRSLISASPDAANPGSSDSSNPESSRAESAAVFTTRHQELGTPRRGRPPPQVLKQVWQSGEHYTLEQFEAKSRAFSKSYLAGLREPTPLEVESLFWKASEDRPIYIEYANDVPGSGFAASEQSRRQKKRRREGDPMGDDGEKGSGWRLSGSPWNLQAIARAPGSLTRFMPDDVPGVTSPMVYIGMLFSWFAWHVEDHELHSLNFLHTGAPKTWYAVPGDRAADLEEVIRVHGYGGNSDRLASLAVLGEKTTLMSPEVLVARGVPCCRLVQYPGEFVVTFPRAYHVGFSHASSAVQDIPWTPRVLSGIRTSRLRDRKKEDRELLVKQEFLLDMISENKLLCSFLQKKSINNVVLWEPDLLPSLASLHSCSSGSKAPDKKSEGGCRIESQRCNHKDKDNGSSDGTACLNGAQSECMPIDSKSSYATSASKEEQPQADADDEGDLPFDLNIDSGSLTCVACGILGFPFMAILQPSKETLERISHIHGEKDRQNCDKGSSNLLPRCPVDDNSEQDTLNHQNVNSQRNNVCLTDNEPGESPQQQHSTCLYSCSSENVHFSESEKEKSDNIPTDSVGSELSNHSGRCDIDAQALDNSENNINWNTNSTFARPRIFCLQHALEIEKMLEGKGGVHALIICHSDYTKLKALAISVAEEIEFQFDCTDVPLANASKSDLHLINISIDDEGHEEDGRDWTSQMGLNLKYCAKLRKERSGSHEQPPLSFWGLFSNQSPTSDVPNLKWLCKKGRTPYKVIGIITSSSATPTAGKVEPEDTKPKIGSFVNVYEEGNGQQTLQQCGLQHSSSQCSDDIAIMHLHTEDDNKHHLVDIPIALAEYPMMHQVCEGPISVNTCNETVYSSDSQDSLPLADSPVEVVSNQECVHSTEQSSSTGVPVQQFLDDGSISMEARTNCLSSHESQKDTLGCRDEQLQVQQDQETTRLCNSLNSKSVVPCLTDGLISEEKHGHAMSAILENEDGCAKTSCCLDTVIKTNKSVSDNQPEACDLDAIPMKLRSSFSETICSADQQCRLTFGCLGSADVHGSTELLSPHELMSDDLQVNHSTVKSVELLNIYPGKFKHESPQEDHVEAALATVIPPEGGQYISNGSNSFDILLGALAEESSVADAPGKDDVGKASLTLMTLASNDQPSTLVTEGKVVEMAKRDTILDVTEDGRKTYQSCDFLLSDLMSRSIGRSSRTDIICYVRRKHKRKRESKSNTDIPSSLGSFARSPCESLRPRTRPAVVEEMLTVEPSTARKGKRRKNGLFQCDIDLCDMKFETRAELNAHKRNICTDESCGKRFSSHKYLKRHQVVHSEVRPLKCPWDGCGMTFKWLWAQTEHVRVHTGERPYKCSAPDCGQTFRYVSDYSRHRKKFNHY